MRRERASPAFCLHRSSRSSLRFELRRNGLRLTFSRARADSLFVLSCDHIIEVFTSLVDLSCLELRRGGTPVRTENEFHMLWKAINDVKKLVHEIFSAYQPAGMGSFKFLLHDHLTEDLRSVGSIECLHAGFHEGTHINLKKLKRRPWSITALLWGRQCKTLIKMCTKPHCEKKRNHCSHRRSKYFQYKNRYFEWQVSC